jgi:hypothetical protein
VGETVDLEEDDTGDVSALRELRALELAPDDVAVPEVAAVECEHAADQGRQQRETEDDDDRLEQAVDTDVVEQRRGAQQQHRVEDERAEPEREHRERQRHPQQYRPHDRVGDAERGGEPERGNWAGEREPRQQRAQREQRQRVEDEDERQAAEQADGHARRV